MSLFSKKTFAFTLLLLFSPIPALADESAEKVYKWFERQQDTSRFFLFFSNGLVPSQEGARDCFTYDEALSVFVFTLHKDYKRAEEILKFYESVYKKHKKRFGKFMGFTDVYKISGKETETRAAGPNAWILMAINYYTYKTNDTQFLVFAEDIGDWLIELEGVEGGITGGYFGNGLPMAWISSEHNFDCFAAFRDLYLLTKEEKYALAAAGAREWLTTGGWNKKEKRFNMGDSNPNYATDLSSWAVLSLGKEYASTLSFAVDKSLNRQFYKANQVEIEGFDFGSPYIQSPYPDKDAIWFEGTAQMVLAFYLAGQDKEGDYFLSQLDKAVTKSKRYEDTYALPYASNEGTPAYSSWMMKPKPLCVAATAWYIFAKERFNPFSITGKLDEANDSLKKFKKRLDFKFTPVVDNFEYGLPQLLNVYPRNSWGLSGVTASICLSKDAKKGKNALEIDIKKVQPASNYSCSITRPFLHPQSWADYKKLTLWIRSEHAVKCTFRLQTKDKDGELWNSPLVYVAKDWQRAKFDLSGDFEKDKSYLSGYGNGKFEMDSIIAFNLVVAFKEPGKDVKIFIDELRLE
ncbi:MAG: hypothetical protein Q8R05_00040 [Candidatus Omnitrophota bacterium]|nr:hypothetical protein [Candidatus Omnitrophota bacterium]